MDQRLIRILGGSSKHYPYALESKFPRILNMIMSLWDDDEKIEEYFTGLLVSNRPNRAGFPPDVAADIMHLSLVHASHVPSEKIADIWESAPKTFVDIAEKSENRQDESGWKRLSESVATEFEQLGVPGTQEGFLEAAETGNRAAVALFLDRGYSTEVCDNRGWTPLMMAAFNGRNEVAAMLIEHAADVNALDLGGNSALHWAAFGGHEGCAGLLIRHQAKIDQYNSFGWTPLIQAAARNHAGVAKLLIDAGVNLDAAADDGHTALHKAIEAEHAEMARLLLDSGADANIRAIDGNTPQQLALKSQQQALIRLFTPD